MESLQNRRQNRRAFLKAQRQAGADSMVCAYLDRDGTPRYFTAPKDAPEGVIEARAFELKNGRPMNRAEEILSAAKRGDFLSAYENAMDHYLHGTPEPALAED